MRGSLGKRSITPYQTKNILAGPKMKAVTDDNSHVAQTIDFVFNKIENGGRGENAGYRHFLLFPLCFHKGC